MNEKHMITLFFLIIILVFCFMIGFACGSGQVEEKHLKEQKRLLVDQNKLLKENIELQKQIIKIKQEYLFE